MNKALASFFFAFLVITTSFVGSVASSSRPSSVAAEDTLKPGVKKSEVKIPSRRAVKVKIDTAHFYDIDNPERIIALHIKHPGGLEVIPFPDEKTDTLDIRDLDDPDKILFLQAQSKQGKHSTITTRDKAGIDTVDVYGGTEQVSHRYIRKNGKFVKSLPINKH